MVRAFPDSASFRIDPSTRVIANWSDGHLLIHVKSLRTWALDAVGTRVWSLLEASSSLADIVERLADEYEAPASQIAADVRSFVNDLLSKGFIREADPPGRATPPVPPCLWG